MNQEQLTQDFILAGKVAIITDDGSGLGFTMAKYMTIAGAKQSKFFSPIIQKFARLQERKPKE